MKTKAIARARFQMNEIEFLLLSPLEFQVLVATENDRKSNEMYDFMDALRWHATGIIIAQGGKKSNSKLRRHFKFDWDRKRLRDGVRRAKVPIGESGHLEELKPKFNFKPQINNKKKKKHIGKTSIS